jgi:hypothetical protein
MTQQQRDEAWEVLAAAVTRALLACRDARAQQGRPLMNDASTQEDGGTAPVACSSPFHEADLLQPCVRLEADRATVIRRTLEELLGAHQAADTLSRYRTVVLRVSPAACRRVLIDRDSRPIRLACAASH